MANMYLPGVVTIPTSLVITAATQSLPMTITVSEANSSEIQWLYTGTQVILRVPRSYGMWQADGRVATILSVSGASLTLGIDSTSWDPFSFSGSPPTPATVAPYGSRNLQYTNGTTQTVPFRSLNNIGN